MAIAPTSDSKLTETTVRPSRTQPTVLFDINHPAHVHLFRYVIEELQRRDVEIVVTSRLKDVTVELLDDIGIEHIPLTKHGSSTASLLGELIKREVRLFRVARRLQPDLMVGRLHPTTSHVSQMVGAKNICITDTQMSSSLLRWAYRVTTQPFIDLVCAPPSFDMPVPDAKRRPLDFQELAYLHPRYFDPNPNVLRKAGVDLNTPYYVIRLVGWSAHHDIGHRGLSESAVQDLVSYLSDYGDVYISAETGLPDDLAHHKIPLKPSKIHDLLYFADLFVGDSGTMSTEAAILGTPSIRASSLVGKAEENVFRELEQRYGLLRSFHDEKDAIAEVKQSIPSSIDRNVWRKNRQRLVEDKPDVTKCLVDTIYETLEQG